MPLQTLWVMAKKTKNSTIKGNSTVSMTIAVPEALAGLFKRVGKMDGSSAEEVASLVLTGLATDEGMARMMRFGVGRKPSSADAFKTKPKI